MKYKFLLEKSGFKREYLRKIYLTCRKIGYMSLTETKAQLVACYLGKCKAIWNYSCKYCNTNVFTLQAHNSETCGG